MYRLLFLFYIEARPELGFVPLKSEAFRLGYSLESLRELEMVQLTTQEARDGSFLHESLHLLFEMIYNGFPPTQEGRQQKGDFTDILDPGPAPTHSTFTIPPLRSHLFDPQRTPLLNKVTFRNHVLQEVIRLMSLSRPSRSGRGKHSRRGRISYAQLGISQFGAVSLTEETRDADGDPVRLPKSGSVLTCTVLNDTLPTAPFDQTITYHPPFDQCDREQDYEVVWGEFARRGGYEIVKLSGEKPSPYKKLMPPFDGRHRSSFSTWQMSCSCHYFGVRSLSNFINHNRYQNVMKHIARTVPGDMHAITFSIPQKIDALDGHISFAQNVPIGGV